MLRTLAATINQDSAVHPTEALRLPRPARAIVTILEDLAVADVTGMAWQTLANLHLRECALHPRELAWSWD